MANEVIGNYEPDGANLVTMDNNATAITKGKLLKADTTNGGVVITAASASEKGPFFVAIESVTSTSQNVTCAAKGTKVFVKAGGAIKVGEWVQADSAVAGQVIEFAASANATTPTAAEVDKARDEAKRIVGQYLGHSGELAVRAVATDAVNNDVICVLLSN